MKFIDKYNAAVGAAITLLTALFGVYWYVFAGYLLCNILDYITGWAKARKTHKESSGIGIVGIVKKVGYWIIILVAFMIPELFIHLGQDLLGVNLSFLRFWGGSLWQRFLSTRSAVSWRIWWSMALMFLIS